MKKKLLIYLIACGWNICFEDLDTNEQKKIFRIFVLIAVLFLIDNKNSKIQKLVIISPKTIIMASADVIV